MEMKSSPPSNFHGNEDSNLRSLINEDRNLKESNSDLHSVFTKLLEEATFHETNANQGRGGMKKNKLRKYISFWQKFQNKFTKQDKTSTQTKEESFKHDSRLARKLKLNSMYMVVNCFKHEKEEEEEIEVPYMKLEKLGYHTLRRDAFGPIYLVT